MEPQSPVLVALEPTKPVMRGWLHLGMTPFVVIAGIVLIVLAPAGVKLACAIYVLSSLFLFGNSALYHRRNWSPTASAILRRVDHANIFLFIAGSYTPLAVKLLEGTSQVILLSVIWGIAGLGVLFRVFWLGAPRALYTALYIAMGWAALFWLPEFWRTGGPAIVILLAAGGIAYTVGAIIYALKRPNPSPRYFGFHEIFHACTILAALLHLVAIWLAVLG